MTSVYDSYKFFGVPAPDTTPLDESFMTFTKNSRAVTTTRFTYETYLRDGFDFYHTQEAVQLARDYLQGCYDDYFFVQGEKSSNTTDFYLWIGDIDFDGDNTLTVHDANGFLFRYQNSVRDYYRASRNGSVNFPSLAIVNGTGSSSSSPSHSESFSVEIPFTSIFNSGLSVIHSSVADETLVLDNSDGVQSFMYSSFDGTPHLIEGVQNYAVAAFVVCFAVLAFRLADRLFRRVY